MEEYKYNNLYEIEERKQLIAVSLIKLRTENAKKQKEVVKNAKTAKNSKKMKKRG